MKLWMLADRFFDSSMKWFVWKTPTGEKERKKEREKKGKKRIKLWKIRPESKASAEIGNREGRKCNLSRDVRVLQDDDVAKIMRSIFGDERRLLFFRANTSIQA